MPPETIRELRCRQPFEPFELQMANGDTYPIRQPESLALGGSRIVVGDPVADRIDILAVISVVGYRML